MSDLPPPPPPGWGPPPPPPPFSPGGYPPPPPPGAGAPPPPPFGTTPGYGYGVPQAGYGPQHRYATWGKRLGAWLLDGLLVALFFAPAIVYFLAGPTETFRCDNDFTSNAAGFYECSEPTDATVAVSLAIGVLAFLAACLYHAKMTASSGQTLGKRALGIRVVDAASGGAIGFGRAFGRALMQGLGLWICGPIGILDHLWPLWDEQKQTLHDKTVRSVVVDAS